MNKIKYFSISFFRTLFCCAVICLLSANAFSQPANDDCANAILITPGTACVYNTYTNLNATASSGAPAPGCANYQGGDVWFKTTVPASGHLIIDTQQADITDGGMAIYSGTCGSLTLIECDDDDSPNGLMPMIDRSGLTPGSTIYIRFWEYGGDLFGSFNICVYDDSPPPVTNDECANAIPLTVNSTCSYSTFSNVGATASSGAPVPGCANYLGADIWFKVTVPSSGQIIIDSKEGTITDCGMAIYSGTCGSLTLIECDDDDSPNGLMPMINRSGLTPGSTIYIRFWEYGGNQFGTFGLCAYTPPTAPPCASNPAAGDFCTNPTPICNLNGYCGNTSSAYTVDSPGNLGALFCGSLDNNSWLSFVAEETTATLNLFVSNCTHNWGIQMQIFDVTGCTSFTAVSNCFNPGTAINGTVTATGLVIGHTYYVMIDGWAGDVCDYVISAASGVYTADAGPDVTICAGQSTTLNASGGSSYVWSPTTGLSNPNISNPVASPSTTTTYTVSVTGGNPLCPGTYTDQVTVFVNGVTPTASNNGPICSGQTLNLTSSSGTGNTYSWSGPNGFTSTAQNPSISNATPSASGVYTVTVTNGGCSGTASTTVSVSNGASVTASASPASICAGQSTTLTAGGASTYSWSSGGSGSSISVTPGSTTTYTVTGTISGCTGTATVSVTVNPAPSVTASASPASICAGQSTTLTAGGASTYSWSSGGSGSSTSVTPGGTTTYTVTGTSSGCTGTATVSVTVNPLPNVTASASPAAICTGQSTTLSAGGASTYSWSSGGSGSSTSVTPGGTTTYTVTGTSSGCAGTATVSVTVNPLPNVTASASPATICNGQSAILTAGGAGTYSWSTGGSGSSISVSPVNTITYTVTGTSLGCTGTASVSVTVNDNATLSISATPATICSGQSSSLNVSGASTYAWSTGGTGSSITVSPANTTTYSVTGTILGCTGTATVSVTVNPLPNVTASASPAAICTGQSTTLSAGGASTYSWSSGGSGSSTSVTPAGTTTYTVTGTSLGCTGTATVSVTVNPLPNVTASASPATICAGQSTTLTAGGADTYSWSSGGSGSSTSVTPGGTTTYTVTGTSLGCTGTATVSVTVNPLPNVTASASPAAICVGQSTTLTAGGASTYSWSSGGSGTSTSVTPGGTTTYTVTGTSLGCTGSATVSVTVNPLPNVTASTSPAAICVGQSTTLTAGGAGTYSWSSGGSGSSISVTPGSTTTYTVTGTSSGCTGTATVSVNVNPLPTITISASPAAICSGQSSTLSASGADTYSWDTGVSGSSISVTPTNTTTYTVTGTSAGCEGTANISVTVNLLPNITANATPSLICIGNSSTINASGGNSYVWSNGQNSTSFTDSPTTTTTYSVTGTDSQGCTGTASVIVTVESLPTIDFVANPLTGCSPQTINFTDLSSNNVTIWEWQFGDGSISGLQNPGHTYTSGTYSVTLVGTTNNGCQSSITKNNYIVISSNPIASFSASPTTTTEDNATIFFINQSSGATSYIWNFGDGTGTTDNSINPIYSYENSGTFTVTLYAENSAGCSDTSETTITIKPVYTFYIPNTFSPNNDGKNDVIRPFGTGWDTDYYSMRVYNRWGELVFSTTDVNTGWNGMMQGDKSEAQQGVYTIIINVKGLDDKEREYIQGVGLIR